MPANGRTRMQMISATKEWKVMIAVGDIASRKPLQWDKAERGIGQGGLLDPGIDLAIVQLLMGHASPVTTSIYDRLGERVWRNAVQKLFVPYMRRKLDNAKNIARRTIPQV